MRSKLRSATGLGAGLTGLLLALPGAAAAFQPDLPGTAIQTAQHRSDLTSYRLPVGPWANGLVPTRLAEGVLDQTAWRIEASDLTTLQLLVPLRAQLLADGFRTIYECETALCGGFDFRYSTDVLAEPDMHVDLGDFRYLAAQRDGTSDPEFVTLLVSRSADQGFVQITRIGGAGPAGPQLSVSTKAADPTPPNPPVVAEPPPTGTLEATLAAEGAVALDDLVFASGASTLQPGDYASLRELAVWIKADAGRKVALVGHTDASGSLETNLTLSLKRAESVRQSLIADHGVPADQVQAQGVGYLAPRDSNQTEQGRERNRRVEAMLIATP